MLNIKYLKILFSSWDHSFKVMSGFGVCNIDDLNLKTFKTCRYQIFVPERTSPKINKCAGLRVLRKNEERALGNKQKQINNL